MASSFSRRYRLLMRVMNLIFQLWIIDVIYCQITPPPPLNDSPVIANNRIYYLKTFPAKCGPPLIDMFPAGFVIRDSRALMRNNSPHIIRGNIEIAKNGCLYIEPGSVLKFAPGNGIIVNGTLIARGSEVPGGRITMTKLEGVDHKRPTGDWQDDARLVLGNTTRDGRLELKYKGRWRAICTHYVNFTTIDANVTCRQLGFLKGNFTYHSFARNLTDYILWEKPDCTGSENNLFDCPGAATIKIGRHICDGQEVVGFECEGLRPGLALDHWRGIDFYNSTVEARYQIQDNTKVFMNESVSFLEYLDISYTGLDAYHGRTSEPNIFYQKAAISASPYVPMMNNVTIKYGAYDGLNLTEIIGPIKISNSTISYNRGYGMFIQSSVGRCLINTTEVNNNYGDGIKFYISNLTIFDFRTKFPPSKSFCAIGNTYDITFPFYEHMDLVQVNGNDRASYAIGGSCERTFSTSPNMKITLHFMIMERDPATTGMFIIHDGGVMGTQREPIPIYNGSFPQSITSKTNTLYIKFQYTRPPNLMCEKFPPCIRFLLEFTSGFDVEEEFRLLMSNIHDNIGYGVNIQDMRSKIRISNETIIANNKFGAGVLVYKGAGDIIINGTRIENNADAGVNITYSGGFQLFNTTQFIANKGYGIITEYIKFNHTRLESQNKIEFVKTTFMWNELIGLRMGNYCGGANVLINESYFAYNFDEAIEYLSCNISIPTNQSTKLNVRFNKFNENFRHAILMQPLLNTDGIISNNSFANHTLATVRINNGYDLLISRWYQNFPVNLRVFENVFKNNMGRYALYIRLTQSSPAQSLDCKFNTFLQNKFNDSFQYVNPRSRANAVVVLSSNNIQFKRNYIFNPDSLREVATHLIDPSVKINATENYWGQEITMESGYSRVYNAIFDQDDRYNLAQILYYPALKTVKLYDNYLSEAPRYVWQFNRGDIIGGIMENTFVAEAGKTYYVDKDIYIVPDRTLDMAPNSKLKFATSIGMVVHGILDSDGERRETPVVFDVDDREPFVPMENRTTSIRLVDGFDEFEGRLEVEINGTWGTVCYDGWIVENSLLACQQLGLAFSPDNPTVRKETPASNDTPILMSWVSCEEIDVDLTQCRSVNIDAETCDHSKDIFIRCQKPSWAGITLAAAYKTDQNQPVQSLSKIRFMEINNAGLLDSDVGTLTPALRIDYNYYEISWLNITNSMSDGILISYNQPTTFNKLEYITVLNSTGNGVVTKSPKLEIFHSRFDSNQMAGFLYDPFFTEYDALLIRNTIYITRRVEMFEQPQRTLPDNDLMFLLCTSPQSGNGKQFVVELSSSNLLYIIVLQVLDYLPVEQVEKVIVYDSDKSNINSPNIKRWEIEKDLVDFPVQSSSSVLTIQLTLNGTLSGRLAFVAFSQAPIVGGIKLLTAITNTSFNLNNNGVITKHYNSPSNRRLEIFHRHVKEDIYLKDVKIFNSLQHTMHMPSVTKFTVDYIPSYEDMSRPERVATINYTVFQCEFRSNAMGILAEHNHVDFANNVWKWTLDHVTMQDVKAGGVEIEVPRVNDGTERKTHAVSVVDSNFINNNKFAFTVSGYYTEIHIDRNAFTNNKCLLGLISIKGMEKSMTINYNSVRDNVCRYMIDIDIISHSEYFTSVRGAMTLNDITNNRYEGTDPPGSDNSPKTYAVAVRGLQDMEAHLNLFRNPSLQYELVAGITSILLGSSMNATLNYWGYTDQPNILKRIFDFDDWNNFAIAEYFPYLTSPERFQYIPSTGLRQEIYLDPDHLGGRVEKSQILMEIGRPYIVQSDLTVMPGVTLSIPPGTELQFMPDVGILVLGRLVANGLPYSRIRFVPVQPSNNPKFSLRKKREVNLSTRQKRQASSTLTVRLRGDGTLFKDAGFLELYNQTAKTWNMMCDSQFHERTAEVVCRELGKEVINVKVRFTYLYDYYFYGKPMYTRKEFWYNSYYCRGDETSLSQCVTRYNYNLLDCVYASNYTFIVCGARNLDPPLEYWGNIRFAMDAYEEQPLEADIGKDRSSLTFVDIVGAGMLHGEKVGAVQTTYVTPFFNNINISNSAENGYDVIAPRQDLNLLLHNISGNLGFGINILVLNGESSMRDSSFQPSGPNTMPYSVHGLVDICRLEKEIQVESRLILFYKYGPYTRDCVKIVRSRRTIGLRFLQINLFQEDFSRNSVEIFDGSGANESTQIGHIIANSSNREIQKLYQTTGNVMTINMHASVSFGSYGFIAEVVKLPLSGLTYPNSEFSHSVQQSEIRKNEDGAIQYKSVGETTPSLYIEHCWLGDNGYLVLNLTSPPSIDISLQSTIRFRFSFNQVSYNHGGMYMYAYTSALNTALKGNMTNNVFAFGKNGEALNISGHYFEHLMLFQNYIYNYTTGDYRDVVHVKNVVVNLTHNYMLKNVGHYIIHTYNSDDATDSQIFARNGVFDNNATALRESTFKIGKGRPKFVNNFFVNPLNDFEMFTYPMTPMYTEAIDAKGNWWGSEREAYINGKIYDNSDDNLLVDVSFWPPIVDNRSLVEGKCQPGWVLDNKRCYRFMGGALPFKQAKQFCQSNGAYLAEASGREDFFNYLIRLMVIQQDWTQRVWVLADVGTGRCSALEKDYIVYEEDCTRRYYSFICETDPEVSASSELTEAVKAMIIGICVGVGGIILIIIIVIVVLWCVKSKRREKERFERTASIRSSISNMAKLNGSMRGTKSTVTVLSNGASRERLDDVEVKSVISSSDTSSSISSPGKTKNENIGPKNRENSNQGLAQARRDNLTQVQAQTRRENPILGQGQTKKENPRQLHALRPNRTVVGNASSNLASNAERRVETDTERRGERGNVRQQTLETKIDASFNDDVDKSKQTLDKSNEDLDDKDSFISDSTFDNDDDYDDENQQGADIGNMNYNLSKLNEELVQKQPLPGKSGIVNLASQHNSDDHGVPLKGRPNSNVTDSASVVSSQRAMIHNDLPTPPPDPRKPSFLAELNRQFAKPALLPKPSVPAKKAARENWEQSSVCSLEGSSNHTGTLLVPSLHKNRHNDNRLYGNVHGLQSNNSTNESGLNEGSDHLYNNKQSLLRRMPVLETTFDESSDHLYNNEQSLQRRKPIIESRLSESSDYLYNNEQDRQLLRPDLDVRPKDRSNLYNNRRDPDRDLNNRFMNETDNDDRSTRSSQGFPPYNPVYNQSLSDHSYSTDRYEPTFSRPVVEYPYGIDQQPDNDIIVNSPTNSDLSRSQKEIDYHTPPPFYTTNQQQTSGSRTNNSAGSRLTSSIESDVDYMPRQINRFRDTLQQHTRENMSPHESISSQDSSRFSTGTCPPPYSQLPDQHTVRSRIPEHHPAARSHSSDRLNTSRESRDHPQDQPPPYSPGQEFITRRYGGSRDILYLPQASRHLNQSYETEI